MFAEPAVRAAVDGTRTTSAGFAVARFATQPVALAQRSHRSPTLRPLRIHRNHRSRHPRRAPEKEFGFNAIVVQPPDSHNTIVSLVTVGHGSLIVPMTSEFTSTAIRLAQPFTFLAAPNNGTEVVAYRSANALQLHIVRHQPTHQPVVVRLPALFTPSTSRATLFTHSSHDSQPLVLEAKPNGLQFVILDAPLYCVVEIPLR